MHVYSGSEKKFHSVLVVSKVELSTQMYACSIKLQGRNHFLHHRPGSSMDAGRVSNPVDDTGNSSLRSWVMLETVVCNGYWHVSTSQMYTGSSAQVPEGDVDDNLNLSRWHQMFSPLFVFQVFCKNYPAQEENTFIAL